MSKPDATIHPLHDWLTLVDAFVGTLRIAGRAQGVAALETWRAALAHEEGEAIAALVIENLGNEAQLDLSEKGELLRDTLLHYTPTRAFDGRPAVPPFDVPSEALGEACKLHLGRGGKIDRNAGDVSHFLPLRKLADFQPYRGAAAALYSESGEAWRQVLKGPALKIDSDIVNSLQGKVWPRFSTLAEKVTTCGLSGGALASYVRDMLGCPHFETEELVELRFNDSAARAECFRKPTFADAAGYPPFLPSRGGDEYGYARNLREEDHAGWPEIWHRVLLAQTLGARLLEPPSERLCSHLWRTYEERKRQRA